MAEDWFERLLEKSGRHKDSDFSAVEKLYLDTQAIGYDTFDERSYEEIRTEASDLNDLSLKRAIDNPPWPPLIQDAYLSLWKAKPRLQDPKDMRPSHLVNQMTMDQILSTHDYESLRTWTTLDEWPAAMGTMSLAAKLEDFFDEQKDLAQQQQELAEKEEELLEMLRQLQEQAREGLTEEELDAELDALLQRLVEYGMAVETHEDGIDGCKIGLKQAVKAGVEAARKAVEAGDEMIMGFGTDPGQWTKLDPKTRIALAKRVSGSPTLRRLAEILGRMKRMAIGQWTKRVIHGTDEVYDVTIGRDISRILPSELLFLADEDLEPVFYNKLAEGTLLNYRLRGTEKMAQGAMFVLLDNSGSMSGEPEVYGKSVALSLLDIAKREGRDFYGIHFSGPGSMKEWHFPKGKCEVSDVLDYASYFSGGGTDFETPITRAIEVLKAQYMQAGSVKGDIVIITDGWATVSAEWMDAFFEAKEELGFKLYGMLIGPDWHTLDAIADRLYRIEELVKGDDIREVFTLI